MGHKWQRVPIKEVYAGLFDGPHATPKPSDDGPVFLGIKNITEDGHFDLADVRHIAEDDFPRWTKRVQPQQDDIVFTYEATLNLYAIIPNGFRGCLGRRLCLIRPLPDRVLPRFLYYYFFGEDWRKTIATNIIQGATVDRIPLITFPDFKISLPPLPTQRKIASILSAYDDLIENNTRRITILEAMAQAIYREWFVEFRFPGHEKVKLVDSPQGKIPKEWRWVELTDHGFVGRGKSRHRPRNEPELYGGPYPFFQTGDIKDARIFLWKYSQTYSEAGLAQSKLWEPGTLCITIAANIAETAILARTACFPDSVVGFVPDLDKSDVFYVKMFLDSIKQHMQNVSRGTTQDNLSLEKLLRFQIPTPPFLQLLRFREAVTPLFDELLVLSKKNDMLRTTRDLLLPKLISGQLDVEDLDIETDEIVPTTE